MKNNNSKSIKAPFTSAMRILAVLFGIGFILGFILTPLGVETRSPEIRTLLFAVFFIIVGLLIPLAGLVLLWLRKTRFAGVLAVIGAALMFLVPPADQALFFFTVSPPPAVTLGEYPPDLRWHRIHTLRTTSLCRETNTRCKSTTRTK